MFSISPIYSVGDQLYRGSDSPHGHYLDELNDLKNSSVANANFYGSRETYEISGFYSDEDEDDAKSLSPQPYLSAMQAEQSPCFADHMRLSITDDAQPTTKITYQTTRKRSLTNCFNARPDPSADSKSFNSISNPTLDSSATRQVGRSDKTSPIHSRCEAPAVYLARPSYLSQARRKLLNKSIDRHITVGFQPRVTGLSAQEKNEYYQKIWMHRQNRLEAHQKMTCNFELIPEEEEI